MFASQVHWSLTAGRFEDGKGRVEKGLMENSGFGSSFELGREIEVPIV